MWGERRRRRRNTPEWQTYGHPLSAAEWIFCIGTHKYLLIATILGRLEQTVYIILSCFLWILEEDCWIEYKQYLFQISGEYAIGKF